MTSVYLLWHERREMVDGKYHEHSKLIGVYATEADAKAVRVQLKDQPGFRDLPDAFKIYENVVDKTGLTPGVEKPREL